MADTRERIITAAASLLAEGGGDAVSTRAVAAAAGVQAPTLYRLFGDKQGLLEAVTAYGFERYLVEKKRLEPSGDPVADLADGWDNHVEFGLTHPAFYVLMFGSVRPGHRSEAAKTAYRILVGMLERVAAAGRLRMPPETAAQTIQAAGTGVVLNLIATPEDERDPKLADRTRDLLLAAITTSGGDADDVDDDAGTDGLLARRALALDAALGQHPHPLSGPETALLHDWLHRLAT
jgi:AcrR family transcriptional regulator